jgi:hypothetical protein
MTEMQLLSDRFPIGLREYLMLLLCGYALKEALLMLLFSKIELAMSSEDKSLPEHPMERPMPVEEEAEIEALEEEQREEEKRDDSPSDH